MWFKPVLANIYLYELGLGGVGGSSLGGAIIFLLILYGAFFGANLQSNNLGLDNVSLLLVIV